MAGRPPETSDEQYLRLFEAAGDPVLFTSEVAAEFDVTQQGAYNRLSELRDRGLLDSKKGQERAWWLTERGWRAVTD